MLMSAPWISVRDERNWIVSLIVGELVAYTKTASGQVKDKEHWIRAVNQSLYKLNSNTLLD
ncbi:hypothetical protein MF628_005299 [Paenibacillus polymyxa]|uniref:hypothetical protein n=1 Tax=Paenibacillus polymyxa TaxID=1406 RepID=UPI0020255072|nr:hypothetical protein [Paenibacillus polymyxa]URJ45470.3 hypothetical protein MF628_005299 [Paenibacillus polymyxa]